MSARDRVQLVGRAARHDPRLIVDYARFFVQGRRLAPVPPEARAGRSEALDLDAAVAELTKEVGPWEEGPALRLVREHRFSEEARRGGGALMAGDASLGELAYAAVRALEPAAVVETGVATGITSAFLLAALEDNGSGELHSIDLPTADLVVADRVGAGVPAPLRERWRYHWGAARRLLPRLLAQLDGGPLVFVHDSDHSYAHMSWELDEAWRRLEPGDVILADDVDHHRAFDEVAARGSRSWLVSQPDKKGTTGLLIKAGER